MDDHIKAINQRLDSCTKHQEVQNKNVEDTLAKLVVAITDLQKIHQEISYLTTRNESERRVVIDNGNNSVRNLQFTPKLEFPKFNGSNTRTWIKK